MATVRNTKDVRDVDAMIQILEKKRGDRPHGSVLRQAYNDAIDRLRVLESKLIQEEREKL